MIFKHVCSGFHGFYGSKLNKLSYEFQVLAQKAADLETLQGSSDEVPPSNLISQNIFVNWFEEVNAPSKSST